MKKIEAWKTEDNKIFEDESRAKKHQDELNALEVFQDIYYRGIIENADDIINLLIENKSAILDFYGLSFLKEGQDEDN